MALTPLGVFALRWLLPAEKQSMDGVEAADDLHGSALIIGFGRFGQVASQYLLARGIDVSIIDIDTEMIRSAAEFGFKVYYGDGCRLDMLRAAGAGEAKAILVCVDKRDAADRAVEIVKAEFPLAKLLVRSYDREHALKLVEAGVDVQIRETFESAMKFGETALRELGVPAEEAAETAEDIRRRDAERFALETDRRAPGRPRPPARQCAAAGAVHHGRDAPAGRRTTGNSTGFLSAHVLRRHRPVLLQFRRISVAEPERMSLTAYGEKDLVAL